MTPADVAEYRRLQNLAVGNMQATANALNGLPQDIDAANTSVQQGWLYWQQASNIVGTYE